MERPSPRPAARSREAGSAYVVVLVVVAVLSAFALSFVTQTGVRVSAGVDRTEDAQAAYLAEAAANHAMWRILHEPGFPADENVYSMHGFGGGRYGYRVRPPTPTTFATIATVGAVGDAVVRQSWGEYVVSRIMTVYGQSTSNVPPYRRLAGATWGAPGATLDVGSSAVGWAELRGDPHANEIVAATIGGDDVTRLAVWNGASWGNALVVATGNRNYKSADVAYESSSGDALVVAWSGSGGSLRYIVWNGSAWTLPLSLATGEASDVTFVRMASSPKSDEILVVAVHANDDIRLLRWDGLLLTLVGGSELETNAATNLPFIADVMYERDSGEGLVVWGRRNQTRCGYAVWNGFAILSGGLLPAFGSDGFLVRGASNPVTNDCVVAIMDKDSDLNAAVWDGTAWIDSAELDPNADQPTGSNPNFDVAWEDAGTEAIVAWARTGSSDLRFVQWSKGVTLASRTVRTGPAFGAGIRALRAFPVDGMEDIVVLGSNASSELRYSRWIGDKFVANPAHTISTSLSATDRLPFGVARAAS
jgi:hypothetical protein